MALQKIKLIIKQSIISISFSFKNQYTSGHAAIGSVAKSMDMETMITGLKASETSIHNGWT